MKFKRLVVETTDIQKAIKLLAEGKLKEYGE